MKIKLSKVNFGLMTRIQFYYDSRKFGKYTGSKKFDKVKEPRINFAQSSLYYASFFVGNPVYL